MGYTSYEIVHVSDQRKLPWPRREIWSGVFGFEELFEQDQSREEEEHKHHKRWKLDLYDNKIV